MVHLVEGVAGMLVFLVVLAFTQIDTIVAKHSCTKIQNIFLDAG